MVHEYGVYEQGAMFSREDFDPVKTISYFCNMYQIELDEEIKKEIETDKVTDKHFDFLCTKLEVKPKEKTLQAICVSALNPYELNDLFLPDASVTFENEMVHAKLFSNLSGVFMFADEDKLHEDVEGECLMLCFNIPYVWNIRDAIIPCDKRIAVFQLQEATKSLLKDNIDWESRLGCLYASGQST